MLPKGRSTSSSLWSCLVNPLAKCLYSCGPAKLASCFPCFSNSPCSNCRPCDLAMHSAAHYPTCLDLACRMPNSASGPLSSKAPAYHPSKFSHLGDAFSKVPGCHPSTYSPSSSCHESGLLCASFLSATPCSVVPFATFVRWRLCLLRLAKAL